MEVEQTVAAEAGNRHTSEAEVCQQHLAEGTAAAVGILREHSLWQLWMDNPSVPVAEAVSGHLEVRTGILMEPGQLAVLEWPVFVPVDTWERLFGLFEESH